MVKSIYAQIFNNLNLKKTADEKNPNNSLDLPASPSTSVTPGSLFHRFLEKYRAASPEDKKKFLDPSIYDFQGYGPFLRMPKAWNFLRLDSPESIFLPEEKKKILALKDFFGTNFREYSDPQDPYKIFTLHGATYNRPFYEMNQFLRNHTSGNIAARSFFSNLHEKDDKSKPYYLRLFGIPRNDYYSVFSLEDPVFSSEKFSSPRFYEDIFYRLFIPELDKNNVPVIDSKTKRVKLKLNPRFHETQPYDNILRSFLPREGLSYYSLIDPMFSPNMVPPGLSSAYYNYFKDPGVAERFPDYAKLQNIYLSQFYKPFVPYLNNFSINHLFDAANVDINNVRQEYLRHLVKNPLVDKNEASEYAKLLFSSFALPHFLRMHGVPEDLVRELSINSFNENLLDGSNFYRVFVGGDLFKNNNFKDIDDIKAYYGHIPESFWKNPLPSNPKSSRLKLPPLGYLKPRSDSFLTWSMANLLSKSLDFYTKNKDSNKKVPVEFFDDLFEKLAPQLMDFREQARVISALENDARILENQLIYSFENLLRFIPNPEFNSLSILDFYEMHKNYWFASLLGLPPADIFSRAFKNMDGFIKYNKLLNYIYRFKAYHPEEFKKLVDALNNYYNFDTFVLGSFSRRSDLHKLRSDFGILPVMKILE